MSGRAGEGRNFAKWNNTLMRMRAARPSHLAAAEVVVDVLQNKDNKALVFTDQRLVYINLQRQRARWSFSLEHLTHVTEHGEARGCCGHHRL